MCSPKFNGSMTKSIVRCGVGDMVEIRFSVDVEGFRFRFRLGYGIG